jgi:type II secretion system (T2SS) protein E
MTPEERERLGNLLIDEGLITEEELSQAIAEGGARNQALAGLLGRSRHPRRTSLAQWLAADYRMPEIPDLRRVDLPPSLVQLIPQALARRLGVLPLARFGSILIVARGAASRASIQELRKVSGLKIKVPAADEDQVAGAIEHLYGGGKKPIPEPRPFEKPLASLPEEDSTNVQKVDTVPILNVATMPPPPGTEMAFTEIEEIVPAVPIGRAEFEETARTPFGQMYRAWDDLFRDGKVIKAPRVG